MQNRPDREEPRDIEVFLPRSVELLTRESPPQPEAYDVPRRKDRRPLVLLLFVATCGSTFFAWLFFFGGLVGALQYAGLVMSTLLFHEMGHYLQARRYNVPASLPYFLPMPVSPLGTMGAVIFQGAGVADRKQMFDIAISGPLAGLLIALPVTYFGVLHTHIVQTPPDQATIAFGDPLIIKWMVAIVHRPLNPGEDVALTPLLFAGWVGIFVTALNLIPIGQLDGGHILYTLIGRRAHVVALALLVGAMAYMVITRYFAYGLIVILLLLFGPRHPPTADDTVPLGPFRVVLGWLTLAFIVVGFTPTPIVSTP
jgi:membrane-associated protease RseP (regulator of RpoE activity)